MAHGSFRPSHKNQSSPFLSSQKTQAPPYWLYPVPSLQGCRANETATYSIIIPAWHTINFRSRERRPNQVEETACCKATNGWTQLLFNSELKVSFAGFQIGVILLALKLYPTIYSYYYLGEAGFIHSRG